MVNVKIMKYITFIEGITVENFENNQYEINDNCFH